MEVRREYCFFLEKFHLVSLKMKLLRKGTSDLWLVFLSSFISISWSNLKSYLFAQAMAIFKFKLIIFETVFFLISQKRILFFTSFGIE